jgi:Uma2 family endonuclease
MSQVLERVEEKILTPEEFMALPIERAELVGGKVVELMPAVFDHDELILIIGNALRAHVKRHKLGRVAGGGSFRTEENQVRAPDVAFLSNQDLEGENTAKYVSKPPTLAVEIISQNDTYQEVDDKADEFLRSGSKAVWLVNPRRKTVTLRTLDDETTFKVGQFIPGGALLPGFELPVTDIFEELG